MALKIPTSQENSKTNILLNITSSIDSFSFKPCFENEIFGEFMHLNDKKALELKIYQLK